MRIRPTTTQDAPAIAAIISSQSPEPTTAESLLREDSLRPATDPYIRLGAFDDDGQLHPRQRASDAAPIRHLVSPLGREPALHRRWRAPRTGRGSNRRGFDDRLDGLGRLINDFTGVDREYRGRGIALALKVKGINWAKTTGAPYIRTANHSINKPMLAVNQKLGYKPEPGRFQVKMEL